MTRKPIRSIAAALVAATLMAPAASALPPLSENERVRAEFLAAAVGDAIRKNCTTISARMFRVFSRLEDLKAYARGLGYTDADMTRLQRDRAAKAELHRHRDAYLAANGVVAGDADSYCRLGRAEIQKNTLTGWLLRQNS